MNKQSILEKIRTEICSDWKKMREMPLRQKFQYLIMYYKIPLILCTAVTAILISITYGRSKSREYILDAAFLNAAGTFYDEELSRDFAEALGIDTDRYAVSIDSGMRIDGSSPVSISSTQKLFSEINAHILDVCIMPKPLFTDYASQNTFADLRSFLTESQLERYESRLFYTDNVPVGIHVQNFTRIMEAKLYTEADSPVFGIVYHTAHPQECTAFLEFLDGWE